MIQNLERFTSFFLFGKARKILRKTYRLYQKKEKSLDPASKAKLQTLLTDLRSAILEKNILRAKELTPKLHETALHFMPKTGFEKLKDTLKSLGFALIVAVIIRTMWFEPYTIPTGSMRPTLKEGDFLLVSKTDYGINVPLRPSHFYFDPSLVQRGAIFVFSAENMDIADSDTTYFYLFPGKKLFVKRLIAKPGDTLYFYGGKIYGIDQTGKPIDDFQRPWFGPLEHIPFIRFHGHVTTSNLEQGIFREATLHQMGKAVAKLMVTPFGTVSGEMIPVIGKTPLAQYSDLFGFKNFAMARLVTLEQAEKIYPGSTTDLEKGILYLELTHHPTLQGGELIRDEHYRLRPDLGFNTSLLPLSKEQIETLANHLTTCRFIVENGVARRYGMPTHISSSLLPRLPDIENGTYEIQNGKAYQILFGGITKELPQDHPLYRKDPERVQLLYNLGIEFINAYNPAPKSRIFPSRYAYFRNGDLYLLNHSIVKKDAPELLAFLKKEKQKEFLSTSVHPYFPFLDQGPPLNADGTLNIEFIKKYGITIPEKTYLALGDNHAMSADSREFGFVPEDNIRGSPSFLFWPFGTRLGGLMQPSTPFSTFPNLFIWFAAIAIGISSSYLARRRLKNPFYFKNKF